MVYVIFAAWQDLLIRWGDKHRAQLQEQKRVQLLAKNPKFESHVLGGIKFLCAGPRGQETSGYATRRNPT